jgi:hypothetical protein
MMFGIKKKTAEKLRESLKKDVPLYARHGEWVTCTSDHRVCQAVDDVALGKDYEPAEWKNWVMPRPPVGDEDPRCACGQRFWMFSWQCGQMFHFENGGWRGDEGV